MKNQLIKWTLAAGIALTSCLPNVPAAVISYQYQPLSILKPQPQHSLASRYITFYLSQKHYRPITLDKEFSQRLLDRYLCLLDPQRNLLLVSDIQRLAKVSHQLIQELLVGKLDLAYQIYHKVQQRRLERYLYALEITREPLLFDNDDTFDSNRSQNPWPVTLQQRNELWQIRIKHEALNLRLANKQPEKIQALLTQRYQSAINHLNQANSEDVFSLFMNAFGSEIDPHTRYLSPRAAEQFNNELSLSMEGIGAGVQIVDDYVVVRSLVIGGPAACSKAIAINDRIIGIGQPGKEITDVVGWRLDDVVDQIRGPEGTQICLEILRYGNSKPCRITLTRKKIRLTDQAIKSTIRFLDQQKIGILTLPSFYMGMAEEIKNLLVDFEKQQISGVLIDLRGNGGGSLSEVITLTSLFVPPGPILQIRNRQGKITVHSDHYPTFRYTKPIVLLVDRSSASASEIFAAALQDYGRAVIIGEQTFGKGTIQQHQALGQKLVIDRQPLGYLQYTVQKFYRVTGDSTQLRGVLPDIEMLPYHLPSTAGESEADNAMAWDRIPPATYQPVQKLAPLLVALNDQHQQRILNSQAFTFIRQELKAYHAIKQKKGLISLNLQQRQQELLQQEAHYLARINWFRQQQGKAPIKKLEEFISHESFPDFYLEEGVAITQDLINLMKSTEK